MFWGDGPGEPFAGVDSAHATAVHMHQLYWGERVWTASGAELARRTTEIVAHDL